MGKHRVPVTADDLLEVGRARSARRAGRREDPTAGSEELLVARTAGAERELVGAIAGEGGVRVAVDEAGHGRAPPSVQLLDVPVEGRQRPHRSERLDAIAVDQDVGVLHDFELSERSAAQGGGPSRGRRDLGEVADQQSSSRRRHRLG